jgi:hypothetical protein
VFTAADVPIRRCPLCGWREDARATHFWPELHLAGPAAPQNAASGPALRG